MIHKICKKNIFDFLGEQKIIEKILVKNDIEIFETDNNAKLQKVTITNLNQNSKYWTLNLEANSFQPQGNKVEKVIFEQNEDILNIILVELKSGNVSNESRVIKKFKNSLTWTYILLNLLNNEQHQNIKVFAILVAQEDKNWNKKETLNILSSTKIKYTKRSFFTTENKIDIDYQDLIKN